MTPIARRTRHHRHAGVRGPGRARRGRGLAFAAAALLSGLSGCAGAQAQEEIQSKAQQLVDRATLTAQQVMDPVNGKPAQRELRLSKGVMICPSVFKMGFLLAGSGGGCVLLARDANGSWSAPAFYSVGSGSVGFQVGVQDEQLVLFIMSQRGLNAILNTHFRLGATASASFATFGGGIEGATSTALDADIVALELNKGLFAGISLQGSFVNSDADADRAYYGQTVGPEDIVVAMRVNNPGDDPLRAVLTKLGSPVGVAEPGAAAPSDGAAGGYGPPRGGGYGAPQGSGPQGSGPQGSGPLPIAPEGGVQQQDLPPPRRG